MSGLNGVNGIGVLVIGLAAEAVSPAGAVALSGVIGLLAVVVPLVAFRRTGSHIADPADSGRPSEA